MKVFRIEVNGKSVTDRAEFLNELYAISKQSGITSHIKFEYLVEYNSLVSNEWILEADFFTVSMKGSEKGAEFQLISSGNGEIKQSSVIKSSYLDDVDLIVFDKTELIDVSTEDGHHELIKGRPLFEVYLTFGDYEEIIPGEIAEDFVFICNGYNPALCKRQCVALAAPHDETFNGRCIDEVGDVMWIKIKG